MPSAATPVPVEEVVNATAPGPWDDILCALPGCGGAVYMERHTSMQIMAGSTAAELRQDEHVSSWEVTCANGHTILTSGDTEAARFGLCEWHEDEEHDCPRQDMEALRKVTLAGKHKHMVFIEGRCRECGEPRPSLA